MLQHGLCMQYSRSLCSHAWSAEDNTLTHQCSLYSNSTEQTHLASTERLARLSSLSCCRPLVDTRPAPSTSYPACSIPASRRAHLSTRTNALPLDQAGEALQHVLHTLPMAYERVALPCSQMNCGDMVYRR